MATCFRKAAFSSGRHGDTASSKHNRGRTIPARRSPSASRFPLISISVPLFPLLLLLSPHLRSLFPFPPSSSPPPLSSPSLLPLPTPSTPTLPHSPRPMSPLLVNPHPLPTPQPRTLPPTALPSTPPRDKQQSVFEDFSRARDSPNMLANPSQSCSDTGAAMSTSGKRPRAFNKTAGRARGHSLFHYFSSFCILRLRPP